MLNINLSNLFSNRFPDLRWSYINAKIKPQQLTEMSFTFEHFLTVNDKKNLHFQMDTM